MPHSHLCDVCSCRSVFKSAFRSWMLALAISVVAAVMPCPLFAGEVAVVLKPHEPTYYPEAADGLVRVIGVMPEVPTADLGNSLVVPRMGPGAGFYVKGLDTSMVADGVSLVLPAGSDCAKVTAYGGTTTVFMRTDDLFSGEGDDEDQGSEGDEAGDGSGMPDAPGGDLGDLDEIEGSESDGPDSFSLFRSGLMRAAAGDDAGAGAGGLTVPYSQEALAEKACDAVLFGNESRYILKMRGRLPKDVLVLQDKLNITGDSCIWIGGDGTPVPGVNFYMGDATGLVVERSMLESLGAEDGAVTFRAGTKSIFGKDVAVLVTNGVKDLEEDSETSEGMAQNVPGLFRLESGAEVDGLENVVLFYTKSGWVTMMRLEPAGDGSVNAVEHQWTYSGPLESVVNALAGRAARGEGPRPVMAELMRREGPEEFAMSFVRPVALSIGQGTLQEMQRTSENVVGTGARAAVAFEDGQIVKATLRTGRSRGTYKNAEGLGLESPNWTRSIEGLDLEAQGRYIDRFAGLQLSYSDASIRNEITDSIISQDSNVLSVSIYGGWGREGWSVFGFGNFAGAEDKLRITTAGGLLASSEPSRRAVTAGLAATYYPDWGNYKSVGFTGSIAVTNVFKSSYVVAYDGLDVLKVEENNRVVGTLQLQVGVHHLFRISPNIWVKADIEAGGRARGGDLDVTQTVSAAGASASRKGDGLSVGEIFADAALKVRLRDSVAGLSFSGSAGPDGSRSWTGGFMVQYSLD